MLIDNVIQELIAIVMAKNIYRGWVRNLGLINSLVFSGVINSTDVVLSDTSQSNSILAQIIPDRTLGTESSVVNSDTDIEGIISDRIEGGAIRGTNLFHSFEEFSVREGQGAYFSNPAGIENIFSRVTGNNVSQISGKLGVLGNADLFLINPNGIVFGSDGSLDLNGSFLATTANSLIFEDGTQFSATETSASPLLTISIPVGLQFGETVGSIHNQSQAESDKNRFGLVVEPNETLALVGGNVSMEDGFIIAPRARIELGSVAAKSRVSLRKIDLGWALSYEGIKSFGDIELTQSPVSDNEQMEGSGSLLTTFSIDGRGGGNIQVRGRRVTIANGSQIFGTGANLVISASETVQVSGTSPNTFSAIASQSPLVGTEGNIIIDTKKLIVRDGGRVTSETVGSLIEGQLDITTVPGGNLTVNASESVELRGNLESLTGLLSRSRSFGAAGDITINTQKLTVSDGATISAESAGENLLDKPIETGQAGNIDIIASEFVELNNGSISSKALGLGGDAGNLTLKTEKMNVFNNSNVTVSHLQGRAGNIEINANSLSLDGGSITAETAQTGGEEGANIDLKVSDLLKLENESEISAKAIGSANGGNINIDAGVVFAFPNQNNDIIATASQGTGGNIDITTKGIFGIEERSLSPNTNDINASSEFGLDGTVDINELDVNPVEGLEELPIEIIDVARLVAQNLCQQGRGSEFVVTGKGGIAPSPSQAREGEIEEIDLVEPANSKDDANSTGRNVSRNVRTEAEEAEGAKEEIVEAQGWIINDRGTVELVAHQTNTNNFSLLHEKQLCP